MKFYDLIVQTENIEKTMEMAKKLGWDGIGFITDMKKLETVKETLSNHPDYKKGLDVSLGVKIKPKNPKEVRKKVRVARKNAELIIIEGGINLDINREVVETPEVDILIPGDLFVNYIMGKFAAKNNVSIAFNFSQLLFRAEKERIKLLSNMIKAAKILKKYKTPFVLSSCATSEWDIRSPSDIMSFGRILGFQDNLIRKSISNSIIKENRRRLSPKWIMPGIEIE